MSRTVPLVQSSEHNYSFALKQQFCIIFVLTRAVFLLINRTSSDKTRLFLPLLFTSSTLTSIHGKPETCRECHLFKGYLTAESLEISCLNVSQVCHFKQLCFSKETYVCLRILISSNNGKKLALFPTTLVFRGWSWFLLIS